MPQTDFDRVLSRRSRSSYRVLVISDDMRFFVSRFFGFCGLPGSCSATAITAGTTAANNKRVGIRFDPNEATKSSKSDNCHRGHPHIGLHILP